MWIFAIRAIQRDLKEIVLGTMVITLGLALCFGCYTLTIAYVFGFQKTLISFFWFFVVPFVSIFIIRKFARRPNPLVESLSGLMLFYAMVAFLTISHLESAYSQFALTSALSNFLLVGAYILIHNYRMKAHRMKEDH